MYFVVSEAPRHMLWIPALTHSTLIKIYPSRLQIDSQRQRNINLQVLVRESLPLSNRLCPLTM